MKITPQRFAMKFKPPRLCLIYEANGEGLFHDFPLTNEELKKPTKEIYEILKFGNPGYLDEIESSQIYGLIEKLKQNCLHARVELHHDVPQTRLSTVDKYKNMLEDIGITIESDDSAEEKGLDFNAVEKSFNIESDSDY